MNTKEMRVRLLPSEESFDFVDAGVPESGLGWLLAGKLAPPEQRITVASRGALLGTPHGAHSR
jgi:hypothetical protein